MEKVELDRVNFSKQLVNLEKKENFLKQQIIDEVFKPQKNKKVMELKNNINDLYEKAVYRLSKQREELLKKVDKGFQLKEDEIKEKVLLEFDENFKQNEAFKKKLRVSIKIFEDYF